MAECPKCGATVDRSVTAYWCPRCQITLVGDPSSLYPGGGTASFYAMREAIGVGRGPQQAYESLGWLGIPESDEIAAQVLVHGEKDAKRLEEVLNHLAGNKWQEAQSIMGEVAPFPGGKTIAAATPVQRRDLRNAWTTLASRRALGPGARDVLRRLAQEPWAEVPGDPGHTVLAPGPIQLLAKFVLDYERSLQAICPDCSQPMSSGKHNPEACRKRRNRP